MRVVHISKITGIAGSEGHLLRLLPGLALRGCEVSMVVLEEPSQPADAYAAALTNRGIDTIRVPIHGHLDAGLVNRLAAHFRALGPDIVHTHLIHADLYGLWAARLAGVPHAISSRHNDDRFRRNPVIGLMNRRAMNQTDGVIAISHALASFVRDVERIPADMIMTIPYGLETPNREGNERERARDRLGIPLYAPLVGLVGRLIHQKGVDVLLRAFPLVLQQLPAARLAIIGDGPLRGRLESFAGELGLREKVVFTGWVDDASRLMPACDVIAVPSRWEGFGLVTLEAMGYAVPVVASRTSALPEIVVDGETGLLVQPEDALGLAEALLVFLENPREAAEAGEAGYRRLVNVFSVEAMVDATCAVYDRVAGSQVGEAV
jgi:glycosyltransferase involved in cell wall biosynthesis